MAAETGEGTTPLHINLDQTKKDLGTTTSSGIIVELYHNHKTGEMVQMCWLDVNKDLPVDELCLGGEELFVIKGTLHASVASEVESYAEWGWLRFPAAAAPQTFRLGLRAGSDGAQVFRKTGHLTERALSLEKIQINEDETVNMA